VDRMASSWFIQRFVDPQATFGFTDHAREGDIPFDMYSGEFSHRGDACTFEVLADRFGIQDAAVFKVGQVVHDLDVKDWKYGIAEAIAVGRIVDGLRASFSDDAALLEQGIQVFEALARSFAADEKTRSPRAIKKGKRSYSRSS